MKSWVRGHGERILTRFEHDIFPWIGDLRGALAAVRPTHFAAITDPKRVGALMRAIDGY